MTDEVEAALERDFEDTIQQIQDAHYTDDPSFEHLLSTALDMFSTIRQALREREPLPKDVEALSAKFHDIYQQEAKRQGDVRHQDAYGDLAENVKEFDRVLARYVLADIEVMTQTLYGAQDLIEKLEAALQRVSIEAGSWTPSSILASNVQRIARQALSTPSEDKE